MRLSTASASVAGLCSRLCLGATVLLLALIIGTTNNLAEAASNAENTKKTADKPVKVLLVRQFNGFFGPTDIYIGENEAKLVGREGNTMILCKAPDWNVLIYSKDGNKGFQVPLQKWESDGLHAVTPKKKLTSGRRVAVRDNALHLDCWQIVINANERYYGSDDPLIFRSLSKQALKEVRFKCTRSLPLSPNVTRFIRGLYSIPPFGGLPLELINTCSDGSCTYTYKTTSMKNIEVPSSAFKTPIGYQKAESIGEILMGNMDKKKITELMDTIIEDERQSSK